MELLSGYLDVCFMEMSSLRDADISTILVCVVVVVVVGCWFVYD